MTSFLSFLFFFFFFVCFSQENNLHFVPQPIVYHLMNLWSGERFPAANDHQFAISVSSTPDAKKLLLQFNSSSSATDADKKELFTPIAFGLMFIGEKSAVFHVEVEKFTSHVKTNLLENLDQQLAVKEPLNIEYESSINATNSSNEWNGTLKIPVEFLPRLTDRIVVYVNFTSSDNKTFVFTIKPTKEKITDAMILPNLLKEEFLVQFDVDKVLPSETLDHWSSVWQREAGFSPSSNSTNSNIQQQQQQQQQQEKPSTPISSSNESNILEQGLITWILVSAIFCAILHIFVLAL